MLKSDIELLSQSLQIKLETVPGANTANRIGQLFEDLTNSKYNTGSFTAISGSYLSGSNTGDQDLSPYALTSSLNELSQSFTNYSQSFTIDTSSFATTSSINLISQSINPLIPLINQTFINEFNLSTNYEVYYNELSVTGSLTPTISASPLIGAASRVVLNAGASASLVATNLGTKLPESSDFTPSKLNELIVYSLPEGIAYTIAILN